MSEEKRSAVPVEANDASSSSVMGWHRVLDWRPRSTLSRVLIVFLLVAPIIVAGTMMWAMWDPSKYMRNIDLAVVNEDVGVDKQGTFTNYGDQVVEGLLETDYLNFAEVDQAQGEEGLLKGQYLMVVTIPKNFSEQAVTIISDNPVKPEIHFATNDYYGTNGSVISASLIPQVQTSVENAISKKYADQVIEGLGKLSEGLNTAAEGAGRLDEGAGALQDGGGRAVEGIAKLDSGASELNTGTGQLVDGTTRLQEGVGKLSAGATQLDDGATQLADGSDRLLAGTSRLAEGAGQIDGGVNQLTGMLIPVLKQAQAVAPALLQLVDVLRSLGMTEQAEQLYSLVSKLDPAASGNMVAQLEKLSAGTGELYYNLSDPNSEYLGGMQTLNDGTHRLATGTKDLRSGVGELSTGAAQLHDGATRLHEGTGTLKDGTSQLSAGGADLKDGMDQLKSGSNELATKLADGAAKAPIVPKPDASAQNMAVPINFTESNVHPVQTVVNPLDPTHKDITGGVSMLLVLVFGFLVMLLVAMTLPYYLGRRNGTAASPVRGILAAFGVVAGLNFLVLAFMAIMSATLGWRPESWPMIVLVISAIAAVGAATYQFFLVTFGRKIGAVFSVGAFALGVMVFGGVWPVAAIPRPLSMLHPFHPMTYAKNAFTRATDGIHDGTFVAGIAVLLIVTVLALVASCLVFRARHHGTARILDEHLFRTKAAAGA
ncbi:YhgE/Pip domain-containing protein [uncultured Corynebacterium sp.]|uniref:YhgE/Pip domain-containing protein n=1 Tax=uncultured Corynebacterium sp. TaxID=159447 RepID=UPI00260030D3|nr:YhgE/Pip domain-containing protein [uncultured Corynebacterium sp.]